MPVHLVSLAGLIQVDFPGCRRILTEKERQEGNTLLYYFLTLWSSMIAMISKCLAEEALAEKERQAGQTDSSEGYHPLVPGGHVVQVGG